MNGPNFDLTEQTNEHRRSSADPESVTLSRGDMVYFNYREPLAQEAFAQQPDQRDFLRTALTKAQRVVEIDDIGRVTFSVDEHTLLRFPASWFTVQQPAFEELVRTGLVDLSYGK